VLSAKAPASVAAGAFPGGVTVSPDGQSVYSTELNSFFVRQWDVAANGTLSAKDPASVAAGTFPTGIVVSPDGSSAYVTNQQTDEISQYDVGTGGKLAAKNPASVAGGDNPFGIAIDAAGENVYVTVYTDSKLRHYAVGAGGGLTLSGTPNDLGASPNAVVVRDDVIGPAATIDSGPSGTVAGGNASFTFSASEPGSTFECRLDSGSFSPCTSPRAFNSLGEGAHTFAVRATDPWDNAGAPDTRAWTVDFPDPPANEFTFGRVKRDRGKGTAVLAVQVPGPGDLVLAASRKVKAGEARAEAAGKATVPIRAAGKAKRKLRRAGKVTVRATVTFTPDGGDPNTESTSVLLKKKPVK
jgi:hypothetical protein